MMRHILNLILNVLLCNMLMALCANAIANSWEEQLTLGPDWFGHSVGEEAHFSVKLSSALDNALIQYKVIDGPHLGKSGSVRTNNLGYAWFYYSGTSEGCDRLLAWYDKDENGEWDWLSESGDFVFVFWNYVGPSMYLDFYWYGNRIIGEPVCPFTYLFASLDDFGWVGVKNAPICFYVFYGPNSGAFGCVRTNEVGYAEFSYIGTGFGKDYVLAWYDINEDLIWNFEAELGEFIQIEWQSPYLWVSPCAASPPIGNEIYIQAKTWGWYWESTNNARKSVTLEVVSGPNAGLTKTGLTDNSGIVSFSYTGNSVGIDEVKVYLTDYPYWNVQFVYIYWMERLKFVKYELVSSEWKKPFYTAKLNAFIMNPTNVPSGCDPLDFTVLKGTAKIADSPTWTEVIQDEITFGGYYGIKPGETVMSDTSFSIKTDTSKVKDPKKGIVWCVMYYDRWWNLHVISDVPQLSK